MPETNARLLTLALLAAVLGGCSMDTGNLSTLNLNPFKGEDALNSADYNYFYRRDASNTGYVSPNDLVGPDGRCAFEATATYAPGPAAAPEAPQAAPPPAAAPQAAPPQAAAPQAAEPMNPRSNQALYFTAGPETGRTGAAAQAAMPPEMRTGGGIALGMTECQVVRIAGYTNSVEVGSEAGQRAVTLTYMSGDRPGIYRFRGGRLVTMDRVEVAPPAPKKPQHAAKPKKKAPPVQ